LNPDEAVEGDMLDESVLYLSSNWSAYMSPKGNDRKKRNLCKIEIPKLDLKKVFDMPLSPEIDLVPEHYRDGSEKG